MELLPHYFLIISKKKKNSYSSFSRGIITFFINHFYTSVYYFRLKKRAREMLAFLGHYTGCIISIM